MPSGAKKRKAAKKKNKGKQSHVLSSNNNQHHSGAEEVKSRDERDSDGSETGSPVYQDQNPFKVENEDAEKKDQAWVQSLDGEENGVKEVGLPDNEERGQADGEVAEVVSLVESKEGSEGKDVDGKNDKSAEELNNGNAEFDGYESRVAEKILVQEHVAAIPVLETTPFDGSVKSDYISKEVSSVTNECQDESLVADKRLEEENVAAISAIGAATMDNSVKSIDTMSKEVDNVTEKAPAREANYLALITSPIGDSAKPVDSSSKEVVCVEQSASVNDSTVSGSNELNSKESADNMLLNLNEVSVDSSAPKAENEVFPLSYASSNTTISTKDNETALSSAAPQIETGSGDNGREFDVPEWSKNQPFKSSIPHQAMQKTSWLSCCGLLDVFSGTGR